MFHLTVETLAEILGSDTSGTSAPRHQDLFSSTLSNAPKQHKTYRLERGDGLALPHVVVPASSDVEDFFATAATYYQDQTPLSALIHILSETTEKLLTSTSHIHPCAATSRRSRLACVGVALAESMQSALAFAESASAASYPACKRTLSFSLGRATLLYGIEIAPAVVAERWCKLRNLTGLTVSRTSVDAVLRAHSIAFEHDVRNFPELQPDLVEGLRAYGESDGENDDLLIQVFTRSYPGIKQHIDELKGSFDGRMAAFMRLVQEIGNGTYGVHADEIAVAFFCNRILPGSFAHIGVLEKLIAIFPSAMIWYGFFAALSKSSASNSIMQSLVSKLERDLLEPFSFEQRPKCDVSLEELEVLARAPMRAELMKPSQQRAILVALLPGLDIYTRFGVESDSATERLRRDVEAEQLNNRVGKLLEEALHMLRGINPPGRSSPQGANSRRQRKER